MATGKVCLGGTSVAVDIFLILAGFGAFYALIVYGWPHLFTINIHRHYHSHGKEDRH